MNKLPGEQKNIKDYFYSDIAQLEVIKSTDPRFIVEAPAGYGKTKVLINKTLYNLFDNEPKNHEQILMITFSNNSTNKMRQDIEKEINHLSENIKIRIRNKMRITNYHGLARQILEKYGVSLSKQMESFKKFKVVDENELFQLCDINENSKTTLIKFKEAVKDASKDYIFNQMELYNNIILQDVISNNYITHNAILTLTIKLLNENCNLLEFYQKLYTKIVVDEFQDTNYLSYRMIELLMKDCNIKVQIYGDHLQRIYGFIGTVPDLFDVFSEKHKFSYFRLQTNYRFKNNEEMLILDNRIRSLSENPQNMPDRIISKKVTIYDTHEEEVKNTICKLKELIKYNPKKKIAVLVPQRGMDVETLINAFKDSNIEFYNALNIDVEQNEYKLFHSICAEHFQEHFREENKIIKKEINKWYIKVQQDSTLQNIEGNLLKSFFKLFSAFLNTIVKDSFYRKQPYDKKYEFILGILLENELSRYLSAINDNIQILTIHSAKGLEWDEVFLMDIEEGKLPNWNGMCNRCNYIKDCKLELSGDNQASFIEQLSLFYVGITRARENIHISASRKCAMGFDRNISCIFNMLNIDSNPKRKNIFYKDGSHH